MGPAVLSPPHGAGVPAQELDRVDGTPSLPYLEVEMGGGDLTRSATESDLLIPVDLFSGTDLDLGQVGVDREGSTRMLEPDDLPVAPHFSSESDPSPQHRVYRRTGRDPEVHSVVCRWEGPHEPEAKRRSHLGGHWPAGEATSDQGEEKSQGWQEAGCGAGAHGSQSETIGETQGERRHTGPLLLGYRTEFLILPEERVRGPDLPEIEDDVGP